MATRFTPITSGAPQGGGEIDNLISAIQSIRQMRKQMKEDEWQAKLRAYQEIQQKRTLLEQGKADDAERSAAEYQGRINSMLTNPQPQGGFSLADVDLLATQGKMSKEQYSMLRERASDYVPDSQRLVNFSMMIPNITDEATFASAVQQTGVDFGEAMRLWNESKEGKGSAGNGEPQPKPEPKPKAVTVGEAEGKNWKEQYRGAGRTQPNGISVKAYGTDDSPTMVVFRSDGLQIEKKRDKYVAVYRENGKRIEVVLTVDGDKLVGHLPGKNKIKPEIKDALDKAYAEWETKNIDAKGKSTGFESRFSSE
jgi:hypothetical protein